MSGRILGSNPWEEKKYSLYVQHRDIDEHYHSCTVDPGGLVRKAVAKQG